MTFSQCVELNDQLVIMRPLDFNEGNVKEIYQKILKKDR